MAKTKSGQTFIPDWHYSCTICGQCCRRWHVFLPPEEHARLKQLEWADPDSAPKRIVEKINGYDYIAHVDGRCTYLDPATDMCRIHGEFGFEVKPKGCKLYPYNVVRTFPDQFSAVCRFDCPAVRANIGEHIRTGERGVRAFIEESDFGHGFEADDLDGLSEKTVKQVMGAIFRHLLDRAEIDAVTRLNALNLAVDRLQALGPVFLNDVDLPEILPSFFERVLSDLGEMKRRPLIVPEQWRFLCVLSSYLRRDEEVLGQGLTGRLTRAATIAKIFFGRASPRGLGVEHPDCPLSRRQLFEPPVENLRQVDWELYLGLLRMRLQAYQFLGPGHYNLGFFSGFKAMLLSFPLVAAAAKWSAIARDRSRCVIEPEDIDYAVGAIDHSLGRSALLSMGMVSVMTRQMAEPAAYDRLLHGLLH